MNVEECKVEMTEEFVVGTEKHFDMSILTSCQIRGQHIITNVPKPFMIEMNVFLFLNVNVLQGHGEDAYSYREKGKELQLPTIDAGWPIRLLGFYTGVIPSGMTKGDVFKFQTTILGLRPGTVRTLKLSFDECYHLVSSLATERNSILAQGLKPAPLIDDMILKLHSAFPDQNWIRFYQ